jgi:hypothetical protein
MAPAIHQPEALAIYGSTHPVFVELHRIYPASASRAMMREVGLETMPEYQTVPEINQ